MSILVLGGAGYIGSHTVYKLIDGGFDVVVADNLQTGHIEAVYPDARFYQGDIRDKAFLNDLFGREKIDGVVHFAANSLVAESMRAPLQYYNNNLYGTMVLLEAMVQNGVERIVFSSTAAVYGEPERVPIMDGGESDVFNLGNGVGFSVAEIVERARAVTGHPIPAVVEARRPGDPAVLIASNEKACSELGWKPEFDDIDTIIRTAWEWHKGHPDGYK